MRLEHGLTTLASMVTVWEDSAAISTLQAEAKQPIELRASNRIFAKGVLPSFCTTSCNDSFADRGTARPLRRRRIAGMDVAMQVPEMSFSLEKWLMVATFDVRPNWVWTVRECEVEFALPDGDQKKCSALVRLQTHDDRTVWRRGPRG